MRRGEEEQGARVLRVITQILLGSAVGLAACILLLLVFAVGVSGGWLKEGLIAQLTAASCALGALIGALVIQARHQVKGLLPGLGVGGCLFLLLLAIGWFYRGSVELESGAVLLLAACLCGGALAGLLGGRALPKGKRAGKRRKAHFSR